MWTEQTEISDSTERGVWWEPALLAIILHKKPLYLETFLSTPNGLLYEPEAFGHLTLHRPYF